MNILLLASRFPWPPFTGDRMRAQVWLDALDHHANVTLIAPPGSFAPRANFYPAVPSATRALGGALRVLRGAPFQSLLAARYDWTSAIARAQRESGPFDATIVILSRLDAVVREQLPRGMRILDAIDSLARSAAERAREGSPLTRWFWRAETRRMQRVERSAAHAYDRVLVVSDEDASELNARVIPMGVTIAPLTHAPRAFDFAFWGRLAYFANADAASWLLDEIWPVIRKRLPQATLLIGGADAPRAIRKMHGRDGITVQSPVPNVAALARNVKVALFPVRYGTGQSNKVLEAAEGGCAIVATRKAMRGLDALMPHAAMADDAHTLAQHAIAALTQSNGLALRRVVETQYARQSTHEQLVALLQRAEAAA